MSIFYFMASGVQTQLDDRTGRPSSYNSTGGGLVLESARGPVTDLPVLNVSNDIFKRRYGKGGLAHACGRAFLKESNLLYTQRPINGALWGGGSILIDNQSLKGKQAERVIYRPFPVGMQSGYKAGARDLDLIAFADVMVTGNTFAMQITDGAVTQSISVPFATNHASTMAAIVSALNTALSTFGNGGMAEVITEQDVTGPYLIAVYAPLNATVSYSDPVLTGGATQADVVIDGEARWVEVFQDNPGKWGSVGAEQLGLKITAIDPGVAQRRRFIFSGPVLAGQTFSCAINGVATVSVPFSSDSDTTMQAIADALAARPEIASATVEKVNGATNNDRIITLIAENAGPNTIEFTNLVVTGSGSLPAVTNQEMLKGQLATGEFTLQVFERSNVRIAAETFRVALGPQLDARGRQIGMENKINLASGASELIKVVVSPTAKTKRFKPVLVDGNWTIGSGNIMWLGGGDDGAACTNGQIAGAWDSFRKRSAVKSSLLINGGYTSVVVQQRMVEVAESRLDAHAILDIPQDRTGTQDALAYRMQDMNIDSRHGALYSPWLVVADEDTDEVYDLPPSGHVAAVYAYSERVSTLGHAPAGLDRGKVKGILGLTEAYEDGDREILEPNGINPIVDFDGIGPAVFGEETLQYRKSIMSSVHASRLSSKIQVVYADFARGQNFNPANESTWFKLRQAGTKVLQPYKDNGNLFDYDIVCDIRNNGASVRDEDGVQVWVYYQITPAAKRILVKHIVLPTGVKISEEIARDLAA